jgi:hypothetical protein
MKTHSFQLQKRANHQKHQLDWWRRRTDCNAFAPRYACTTFLKQQVSHGGQTEIRQSTYQANRSSPETCQSRKDPRKNGLPRVQSNSVPNLGKQRQCQIPSYSRVAYTRVSEIGPKRGPGMTYHILGDRRFKRILLGISKNTYGTKNIVNALRSQPPRILIAERRVLNTNQCCIVCRSGGDHLPDGTSLHWQY